MELPAGLVNASFYSFLKPGAVIKRLTKLPDGTIAMKCLVVLAVDKQRTTLAVSSTSNKFAPTRGFDQDSIYVAPGDEKAFERKQRPFRLKGNAVIGVAPHFNLNHNPINIFIG
jgi:hypothetical protein